VLLFRFFRSFQALCKKIHKNGGTHVSSERRTAGKAALIVSGGGISSSNVEATVGTTLQQHGMWMFSGSPPINCREPQANCVHFDGCDTTSVHTLQSKRW
jgi:hypothetical protein